MVYLGGEKGTYLHSVGKHTTGIYNGGLDHSKCYRGWGIILANNTIVSNSAHRWRRLGWGLLNLTLTVTQYITPPMYIPHVVRTLPQRL